MYMRVSPKCQASSSNQATTDYCETFAMRAHNSANSVFVAVSDSGELLGTVNFFANLSQYG
jgi:hypothetical protein